MEERRLLSSDIRLEILNRLTGGHWVTFTALWYSMGLNSGLAAHHLEKLAEAQFIIEEKRFVDRKPQTRYRITSNGKAALARKFDSAP